MKNDKLFKDKEGQYNYLFNVNEDCEIVKEEREEVAKRYPTQVKLVDIPSNIFNLKRILLTYIIVLLLSSSSFAQIPGILSLPDTISRPQMFTTLYISYSDTPYVFIWKYNGMFISSKNYVSYEKAGVYTVDVKRFSQVIHRDTTVVLNSAVIFDRKDTVYVRKGDSVELSYPPNKNVHWSISFLNTPVSFSVNDSSIYLSREADVDASIFFSQGFLVDCFVVVFAPINSVEVDKKIEFSIHPNPTSNTIKIFGLPENDLNDLLIFDLLGNIVLSQKVNGTLEIDLKGLSKGVYFVNIGSTTKKLIKN
jgi:hypothetical protein